MKCYKKIAQLKRALNPSNQDKNENTDNVQESENIEFSSFAIPIEPVIVKEKELSTIRKDTKVIGNIITEGNLAVYGEVKGNVDCKGSLHIYGTVDGNIKAMQIILKEENINVKASKNI